MERVPREGNQAADCVATVAMGEEAAGAGLQLPAGPGLLAGAEAGVLRAWSDGGLRPGGAGAAAVVCQAAGDVEAEAEAARPRAIIRSWKVLL